MKKIIIIIVIFVLDRATKVYLINLQASGTDIDFYIFPFLNFYLMWNTCIGFGLVYTTVSFRASCMCVCARVCVHYIESIYSISCIYAISLRITIEKI